MQIEGLDELKRQITELIEANKNVIGPAAGAEVDDIIPKMPLLSGWVLFTSWEDFEDSDDDAEWTTMVCSRGMSRTRRIGMITEALSYE